jgi:hypothetical protein
MIFTSIESWETLAEIGTALVILGVSGEGAEMLIKAAKLHKAKKADSKHWRLHSRPHLALEWCDKHELGLEIFGFVCWLLVVVGLIIELRSSHEARLLANAENAALKERAAKFELRAEELRAKNLELEERIRPRTVTDTQCREFARLVQSAHKVPLSVWRAADFEIETREFSERIVAMFEKAGYPESNSTSITGTPDPQHGLTVIVPPLQTNGQILDIGGPIRAAFDKLNIRATWVTNDVPWTKHLGVGIGIVIGPK